MKITVVGFLAIVGTVTLVAVMVYLLANEPAQNDRKSDGPPNRLN